jgi:hypothetical protein
MTVIIYYHIRKTGDYRRCVELRKVCRYLLYSAIVCRYLLYSAIVCRYLLYSAIVCRHSPFGECAAVGISSFVTRYHGKENKELT